MQGARENHGHSTHQRDAKHKLPPNVARTHCVLPKQNSMYLRQFLFKKKNFENISRQKCNGPLPEVKYGGLLLLAPHFPLRMRFTHIYGNYRRDKCSLQELNEKCWQQLNNPTIHSSYILDVCHMQGTG